MAIKFKVVKKKPTNILDMNYKDIKYNITFPEDNNSSVIKTLSNNKLWEKKIIRIFEKYLTKDATCIDCGAFIGSHSIIMAQLSKKVIAFEPVKFIYDCFDKTIKQNNITNIILHNKGLCKSKSTQIIKTNYDGDSTTHYQNKKTIFKFSQQADFIPLDEIIEEKIDLIKIDVEGNEFCVLEGATNIINTYRPIIVIEVWRNKTKREQLKKWCEEFNYDCLWLKADDFLLVPSEKNI